MKLIEALKTLTVADCNGANVFFDGSNEDQYELLIHNVKALESADEHYLDSFLKCEFDDDFFDGIKFDEDKKQDWEDKLYTILCCAYMASEEIDYEERKEADFYDDLYSDVDNYIFKFKLDSKYNSDLIDDDFVFTYEREFDMDMT